MSESTSPSSDLDDGVKKLVAEEIARQIKTVAVQMDLVLASNEKQNGQLKKITDWMHEFYGNGSGKQGVFEKRIEFDDQRYAQLLAWKSHTELANAYCKGEADTMQRMAAAGHEKAKTGRDWLLIVATAVPGIGLVIIAIIELLRK